MGDTDSERAFCFLLDRLAPIWEGAEPPSLPARFAVVEAFAAEMRPQGIANFLYSDGEFVFGHAHHRTQADGIVAPPGLWLRHRRRTGGLHAPLKAPDSPGLAIQVDGEPEGHAAAERQEISLLASVPVTAGHWSPLAEGEIVVLSAGERLTREQRRGAPRSARASSSRAPPPAA